MSGFIPAATKMNDPARRLPMRDDETATVPVLLDRVLHEDQRKQVRAILQNRPSGDRAQDAASPLGAEFDPLPETTGPDVIGM